jgi:uncharacterized protein YneF (UPF0154 family)
VAVCLLVGVIVGEFFFVCLKDVTKLTLIKIVPIRKVIIRSKNK